MDGQLASAVGFCCWSLDIGTWLFGSDGLFVILSDSDIFVLLSRLLPNWSLFLTPLCPSNLDASSLHSHLELSDVMCSDSTSSVMTCLFFFRCYDETCIRHRSPTGFLLSQGKSSGRVEV